MALYHVRVPSLRKKLQGQMKQTPKVVGAVKKIISKLKKK